MEGQALDLPQTTLTTLSKVHDGEISESHHSHLNDLALIHRLPFELFSDILVQSVTAIYNAFNRVGRLAELAQVAKYWLEAVLCTPRLWAVVTHRMSPIEVEWSLKRSQNTPLVVINPWDYGTSHKCMDLLKAIVPHASRWKSLESWRCPEGIVSCLETEAQVLEDIDLAGTKSQKTIKLGHGAHFRRVALNQLALTWSSPRLTGLTSLTISNLEGIQLPSAHQTIIILSSSPALEYIYLNNLKSGEDGAPETPETPDSPNTIVLPHLAQLRLTQIPGHIYTAILTRLRFPACSTLHLDTAQVSSWSQVGHSSASFDHSDPHFAVSARHSLCSDDLVHVHVIASGLALITDAIHTLGYVTPQSRGALIRMPIRPGDGEVGRLMIQVARLLELACPATPVNLHLSADIPDSFDPTCLTRFPTLHTISIPQGGRGLDVLQYLGRPSTDHPDEPSWPCSNLKVIDLHMVDADHVGDIKRWVKARWETYDGEQDVPPEGLIEVLTPVGMANERWRPVSPNCSRAS